jgi:hypothetical protein
MLVNDGNVPQVRLPHHVEQIAEQRDDSEPSFDGYIRQQSDDPGAGTPKPRGFIDDVE